MRRAAGVLILLAFGFAVPGSAARPDPCGDPALVSQGYMYLQAKAVEVVDGKTFVAVLKEGRRVQVSLMGAEVPDPKAAAAQASREQLSRLILDQDVDLNVSASSLQDLDLPVLALVSRQGLEWMSGVNLEQLRKGLVRYQAQPQLDWWQSCHFQRAEKAARAAKRGMWKE